MSKTLQERITLAVKRITDGLASMRIPVDETDPDIVLSVCSVRIAELESQLSALQADARRMDYLSKHTRVSDAGARWTRLYIDVPVADSFRDAIDAALSVGQQG